MTQDTTTAGRIAGIAPERADLERERLLARLVMDAPEDYDALDEMGREPVPLWAVAFWAALWLAGVVMIAGLGWLGWMAGRLIAGVL